MKIQKAKELLAIDIKTLDEASLRKHYIRLIDAWRESRAQYGTEQAVRDGFYIQLPELRTLVPSDMRLTHNLQDRMDEVEKLILSFETK